MKSGRNRVAGEPITIEATLINLCDLPIREFQQTVPNLTVASQNLWELIEARNITLYPDAPMRLSASRAIAIETVRGWRIAKEKQSHKIDVIVALAMAAHAATTVYEQVVPTLAFDVMTGLVIGGSDGGGYRQPGQSEEAYAAKQRALQPSVPRPAPDPTKPLNATELFLLYGGDGGIPGGRTP